jgi:hypothetical protein
VTSPAKNSSWAAATRASLAISRTGLPPLVASIHASSSACSRTRAAIARRMRARSSGATMRHASNPRFAAATAASTSRSPATATAPSEAPVPGSKVSSRRPPSGACHAPP